MHNIVTKKHLCTLENAYIKRKHLFIQLPLFPLPKGNNHFLDIFQEKEKNYTCIYMEISF